MKKTPVSTTGPSSIVGKTSKLSAADLLKGRLADMGFKEGQKGLPPSVAHHLEEKVVILLAENRDSLATQLLESQMDGEKLEKAFKDKLAKKLAAIREKTSRRKIAYQEASDVALMKAVEKTITSAVISKLILAPPKAVTPKTTDPELKGSGTSTSHAPTQNQHLSPPGNLQPPKPEKADSGDELFGENPPGDTQ